MKIFIYDDNAKEIPYIQSVVEESFNDFVIETFDNVSIFLNRLEINKPDIVLLDIDMLEINKMEVARKIGEIYPSLKIIIITVHPQFAVDAFGMHAYDYLLKPIDKKRLVKSLEYAKKKTLDREKCFAVNH